MSYYVGQLDAVAASFIEMVHKYHIRISGWSVKYDGEKYKLEESLTVLSDTDIAAYVSCKPSVRLDFQASTQIHQLYSYRFDFWRVGLNYQDVTGKSQVWVARQFRLQSAYDLRRESSAGPWVFPNGAYLVQRWILPMEGFWSWCNYVVRCEVEKLCPTAEEVVMTVVNGAQGGWLSIVGPDGSLQVARPDVKDATSVDSGTTLQITNEVSDEKETIPEAPERKLNPRAAEFEFCGPD